MATHSDGAIAASTGIEGLDDILRGGYPRGRLLLVEGDPGVGKTTLALQFLLEGRDRGERCLYITLSETREELEAVAAAHGWSLDGIELFELPVSHTTLHERNTLFHPSEVELAETTKAVVELCNHVKPARVAFDSLSEIRLLAQGTIRYRREVLALKQYFAETGSTVLLLDDRTASHEEGQLQSLAHGVIILEQLAPLYGSQRRRLRVMKLRGVDFRGGYHDFLIERGGLRVFPRLVAAEHSRPEPNGLASSGVEELDAMLGGGLDRGTSTLILGPTGAGKSSLAVQWAVAAANRGERVAMYVFDESRATLLSRSAGLGVNLAEHVRSERIVIRQCDPAEIPPGQFVHLVRRSVDDGVRVVVIDSLNGYLHAMPDESFLILQLHELLTYLGQKGVVTLLITGQHGLVGSTMTSPTDISYLADTVLLLRHFEAGGSLRKALSVLKKRTGAHESAIRELLLSGDGLNAGPPLMEFRGVLTGVPIYEPKPRALEGPVDAR